MTDLCDDTVCMKVVIAIQHVGLEFIPEII